MVVGSISSSKNSYYKDSKRSSWSGISWKRSQDDEDCDDGASGMTPILSPTKNPTLGYSSWDNENAGEGETGNHGRSSSKGNNKCFKLLQPYNKLSSSSSTTSTTASNASHTCWNSMFSCAAESKPTHGIDKKKQLVRSSTRTCNSMLSSRLNLERSPSPLSMSSSIQPVHDHDLDHDDHESVTVVLALTRSASRDGAASTPSSSPGRVIYHSPESIMLKSTTSNNNTSATTRETSASSMSGLLTTRQKVLKAIKRHSQTHPQQQQQQQSSQNHQQLLPGNKLALTHPKNHHAVSVSDLLAKDYDSIQRLEQEFASFISPGRASTTNTKNHRRSSSSTTTGSIPSLAVPITKVSSFGALDSNSSAVLTEDMLQYHQAIVKTSSLSPSTMSESSFPKFQGDKLAKHVIQSKTHWELVKERKEQRSPKQPNNHNNHDGDQEWLQTEQERALAAKWRRKKQEQKEQRRLEQLRLAELERQRQLRQAELEQSHQHRRRERKVVRSGPVEI